ncbi:hypothetical protein DI005_05910 [Prauserella sp. PE36]|uniref:Uncharacterized protein n=1 Tax=Prauserella endophytica TaxID=1592324 RepID=A0ABY2S5X8_9PSEU|nr:MULTISPECIES: bacteriophage holin [Prauserella]PXY30215.1 hypothetical protein BAY59_13465 [Prauserella coralliicola]RBM22672.1 hypothetical protein DI005_05910 [Prauserella sp. PE36]TKG71284.1 hypothetical protein FCN18_14375 [Prauserella endophytica]
MFYVLSGALVALGILVLGIVAVRLVGALRRYSRTASMVAASTQDQAGLLRARAAAVGVALARRRGSSLTHNEKASTIDPERVKGGH